MLMTDGLIVSATAANDTVGRGIWTGTMGGWAWAVAAGPGDCPSSIRLLATAPSVTPISRATATTPRNVFRLNCIIGSTPPVNPRRRRPGHAGEIGRASCRERGETTVAAGG